MAAASSAYAGEPSPSTKHPISVAVLGGYAINNALDSHTNDSLNLYGVGFGVRAGYTLPMKLYLGAMFQYNLGGTWRYDPNTEYTGRVMTPGAEIGFDIDAGRFTVRPSLGLGAGIARGDLNLNDKGDSFNFAIWPGMQLLWNTTDQIYLGTEIRYTFIFTKDGTGDGNANAFGGYAVVGYRF
ncbi:porin family protein [Pendulispora brunnea]|uniref:Porin family protein n=2 Tax=Pendulispora brunnea TaxID=2905690 RepID=A0ABZ2KLY6_9BACT